MQTQSAKDITQFCRNFPILKPPLVKRDTTLDIIESLFDSNTVVHLEGAEGVGKTYAVTQFAQIHSGYVICLFISNKFDISIPIILTDLYRQIHYYLFGIIPDYNEIISEDEYNAAVYKLEMKCKLLNEHVYFIIDGLDTVDDIHMLKAIVSLFPFSDYGMLKFLIVGNRKAVVEHFNDYFALCKVSRRTQTLGNFSIGEAQHFFSSCQYVNTSQIELLFETFKKPGDLSSIYKLLLCSDNPHSFLDNPILSLGSLFDSAWNKNCISSDDELILAAIAFENDRKTAKSISDLLGIPIDQIAESLEKINFVEFEERTNSYDFISKGFKNYVISRISKYKTAIYEKSLKCLLDDPDSPHSIQRVPFLYNQLGLISEFSEYLTVDRLLSVFKSTKSESQTISLINNGIEAAMSINSNPSIIRMSLLENTLNSFYNSSSVYEKEIQAKSIIGDFEGAIMIIHSTKTTEEKLLYLSQVAMWQIKKGLSPNEQIINEIQTLHNVIDYVNIRDKAVRIAAYLIYSLPEKAVEIIETIGNATKSENSTDTAIASITMSGIITEHIRNGDMLDVDSTQIGNTVIKKVYDELQTLLKNQPIKKVLNVIEDMDSNSAKLLFLRNWLIIHRTDDVDGAATKLAMTLSIEAKQYNPTVSTLRDISSALPYITCAKTRQECIEWFRRQIKSLSTIEIAIHYIELQINISKAIILTNLHLALELLQDIILWSEGIDDLVVQAECLSIIRQIVLELDMESHFDKDEQYAEECLTQLSKCVEDLISKTADHFEVFKNIIRSLSSYDCEYALQIVSRLNTDERRDKLRLEMIDNILSNVPKSNNLNSIIAIIDSIENNILLSSTISKIARKLRKSEVTCTSNRKFAFYVVSESSHNMIKDYEHSCVYWSSVMLIRTHLSAIDQKMSENIFGKVLESWKRIMSSSRKLEVGFDTVYILSDAYPQYASLLLSEIECYKSMELPLSKQNTDTYAFLVKLLIRGLTAASKVNALSDDDYEKIESYISSIPSKSIQCILWNDFILMLNNTGKIEKIRKIFDNMITPIINPLQDSSVILYNSLIVKCAPSYFLAYETLFLDSIRKCPRDIYNSALYEVCNYIMTKTSGNEPYDYSKKAYYFFDFNETEILFSLINKLNDEHIAFTLISRICNFLVSKPNHFSKQQKSDFSAKIVSTIDSVFVNRYPIAHEGYKLCAQIFLEMISQKKSDHEYERIKKAISTIDNVADQSYIWCQLALSTRQASEKKDCLNKAKDIVDDIPSLYEKIWHLEMIADTSCSLGEKAIGKSCFVEALQLVSKVHDKDKEQQSYSRILSLAHRLDPEMARSLASIITNSPDSSATKNEIQKHMTRTKILDSIIEHKEAETNVDMGDDYQNIIWEALGLLNAGIINPAKIKILSTYFKLNRNSELIDAYPLYSWIIENVVRVYSNDTSYLTIIRPLIGSIEDSLKFCSAYLLFTHEHKQQSVKNCTGGIDSIVYPGGREGFLRSLNDWLVQTPSEELLIVDPYFCVQDLDILKLIYSAKSDCEITIVSSIEAHRKKKIELNNIEEIYSDYWRDNYSLTPLNNVKLILLSTEPTGTSPIHDRWIISGEDGIHLGTSFGSIGNRISSTNIENSDSVNSITLEVEALVNGKKRFYNDEKIICRHYLL